MLAFFVRGGRVAVLSRAGVLVALVALADWHIEGNIPLGFLYLFPMLLAGSVLSRFQTAVFAALCTALTEAFDTFEWSPDVGLPRDILIFSAFFGMGLFVLESVRSKRLAAGHTQEIEREAQARRNAEEQLEVLVESSPAAIFTALGDGSILLANGAAHRLLGVDRGALPGRSIRQYFPALVNVPALVQGAPPFRTVMQCRGHREDGEVFLADIWFSTYATSAGARLAAMVADTSEDLRNREEFSLHQLLAAARILVGAVSHEVRNICGAIAVVHENLARSGTFAHGLSQSKDFEALGTLIQGLEKIAAIDLQKTADQASRVDLQLLLEELRIVIEPPLRESGIAMRWEIADDLPPVWADRQSLMQVFLNLVKNSERAMLNAARRELSIEARASGVQVSIRFRDTGCGVEHPERLFRPFQPGAQATGLGLYLSRAFLRSFRADVRYQPEPDGASFVVELTPAALNESHD